MTKQTYRLGALLPRAAGRSADGVAVTALHEYTIDVRDEIPWEWLSITVVAASHIEACEVALDWIMQSPETRACLDGAILEGCASITARSSLASDIRDQGSVQRALTPTDRLPIPVYGPTTLPPYDGGPLHAPGRDARAIQAEMAAIIMADRARRRPTHRMTPSGQVEAIGENMTPEERLREMAETGKDGVMVGDVWRRVDRQGYVIPFDDEPNERDEASRAAWRKRVYAEIAGHNEPTERDEASRLDAALDALAEQPDGEPDDGWDRR